MQHLSQFFARTEPTEPGLCFCVMPFGGELQAVYEFVIKPFVEKIGMKCLRADEIYGSRPIMDDVWRGIQRAEIVIADLTGRNPNVMYELGLCHVLWKKVILITQKVEDVPFDLKGYRLIPYEPSIGGAKRLEESLAHTIDALRKETAVEGQITAYSQKAPASKPGRLVPAPAKKPGPEPPTTTSADWLRGSVRTWKEQEKFGFIAVEGEDFYFNPTYCFAATFGVEVGKRVLFNPLDPIGEGQSRRASRVFIVGEKLKGRVTRVIPAKGFGFAEVEGQQHGDTQNLLVLMADPGAFSDGVEVEVTISENPQGPIGINPKVVQP